MKFYCALLVSTILTISFLLTESAFAEIYRFEVDEDLSQLQAALSLSHFNGYFDAQTPDSDIVGLSGHIYVDVTEEGVKILGSDIVLEESGNMAPDADLSPLVDGKFQTSPANYGFETAFSSTNGAYAALRDLTLSISTLIHQSVSAGSEFSTIGVSARFNTGQMTVGTLPSENTNAYDLTDAGYSNGRQEDDIPAGFEFIKRGLYLQGTTRDTLYVPFYVKIPSRYLTGNTSGVELTLLANIVGRRVHPAADDIDWMKFDENFYYEDSYLALHNSAENNTGAIVLKGCEESNSSSYYFSAGGPIVLPATSGNDTPLPEELDVYCNTDFKYGGAAFYKPISIQSNPTFWLVQCVTRQGDVKRILTYDPEIYPALTYYSWLLDEPLSAISCKPDPIPGDYNGDGCVDSSDYSTWRGSYGQTVSPAGSGADGNGDGRIESSDYSVWRNNFGAGCEA